MTSRKSKKSREFEEHTLTHIDSLYRFGMRLTGHATAADDLVQETYLRAYRSWDKYDQGTDIRAWLFRILKNSFINFYRKESKEPALVDYCRVMSPTTAEQVAADPNNL